MELNASRIRTSHTGGLFMPPGDTGGRTGARPERLDPTDPDQLRGIVGSVVEKQLEIGLDEINNGDHPGTLLDFGRVLGGVEKVASDAPVRRPDLDMETYHEYYEAYPVFGGNGPPPYAQVCRGPLTAKLDAVNWDIATLAAATAGKDADVFMTFVSPGWARSALRNEHYPTEEAFVFAIADAFRPIYKAIGDAGFTIQVDAPDTVDEWTWYRWNDVAGYRKNLEMRIGALNHALSDVPADQVRVHICWGSWRGPHSGALPLEHVIDIAYKIPTRCFSIEAAKPNHTHEWRVFRDHPLADGTILMPGVIDHTSDIIEHPQVVADRLVTYANVVGKENLMAGTDCGMRRDSRVEWAKLQAMVEGARIASRELFS